MSWKVKAYASNAEGRKFKTVLTAEEWDDGILRQIGYWVRNMEPGEKVLVLGFARDDTGKE